MRSGSKLYTRTSIYDGTYVPIGEVPRDVFHGALQFAFGLCWLESWSEYNGRFYYNEGIAPHVTGYVAAIQAEEKDSICVKGFAWMIGLAEPGWNWFMPNLSCSASAARR
jgi:hypothetical protein